VVEPGVHATLAARVAPSLEQWFSDNARDLSWRKTRDPYAIWVSEIMLQQTRVVTVERYWGAFLERFPSVEVLAEAREDAVLGAWSGLGYYRRARLLHKGARHLMEHHAGHLPRDASALQAVPGIGRYTAGAVASIAFDQPVPLVDGNVARVHSRLSRIRDAKTQRPESAVHWSFVTEVLKHGSPRALAQALMELGATVCTPRSPRCDVCPVEANCFARKAGEEGAIPAPKKKKMSPRTVYWAVALRWGEGVLLERREASGLLAGLWCLPLVENHGQDIAEVGEEVSDRFGLALRHESIISKPLEHVFSHRIWVLNLWIGRLTRRPRLRKRNDGRELALHHHAIEGGIPSVTIKLLRQVY